jgi:acetolactate synthase-1/2/3 large subunit
MNGLEVHTAVEYNLPVIWVVLNNGGHGMAYNGEIILTGKSYLTVFHQPLDISEIARSLGAHAFKALNLAEFEESLKQALALRAPCVIEAVVDLDEIPRSLQQRANTLKAFFGK